MTLMHVSARRTHLTATTELTVAAWPSIPEQQSQHQSVVWRSAFGCVKRMHVVSHRWQRTAMHGVACLSWLAQLAKKVIQSRLCTLALNSSIGAHCEAHGRSRRQESSAPTRSRATTGGIVRGPTGLSMLTSRHREEPLVCLLCSGGSSIVRAFFCAAAVQPLRPSTVQNRSTRSNTDSFALLE